MHQEFIAAVRKIERYCGSLIDRNTEFQKLRDARCLINSVLMRTLGINKFLIDTGINEHVPTPGEMQMLRMAIHNAFGAPGDWGGDMEDALRDLYRLNIPPAC